MTKKIYLHFHDEFRGIGCGKRLVEVKRKKDYFYVRPVSAVPRHWSKMPADRFVRLFADWLPPALLAPSP